MTGPDLARASKRTQTRRRSEQIDQKTLLNFGFNGRECQVNGFRAHIEPDTSTSSSCPPSHSSDIEMPVESEDELGFSNVWEPSVPIREESFEPVLTWDGDGPPDIIQQDITDSQREELAAESWEEEMDERVGLHP